MKNIILLLLISFSCIINQLSCNDCGTLAEFYAKAIDLIYCEQIEI